MPPAFLAEARRHAARLIELMPDNPGSCEIMSYVLMHDAEQSLEDARRLATTFSAGAAHFPPQPFGSFSRQHVPSTRQTLQCFLIPIQMLFSCKTLFRSDTILYVISCSHMECALLTAEDQDNDVGVIQYALQVMYFLLWVSLHVLLWPLYPMTSA